MEIIAEFFGFMLQLLLWAIFWSIVIRIIDRWRNRPSEEEIESMYKRVSKMIHEIKPEQHGDMIYWFDAETDQFLGQGRNEEEIKKHLLERFKGHIFLIDKERALAGPRLEEIPLAKLKLTNDGTAIN
jgi:hypothetical protein